MQAHLARPRARVLEGDLQPIDGQCARRAVGPFAESRRGFGQQVVESEREELVGTGNAVQVEMLQEHRAAITVHQREARRARSLGSGALGDGLDEQRLSRAELAGERHEVSRLQDGTELLPQGARRRGSPEEQLPDDHRPQRRKSRGRPMRTMSLATRGVSPTSAAARSPAIAWTKTASRPRSDVPPMPERLASRAAAMPVRTSPVPAVAIPGFPAAQMALDPSGSAITVCAPLSATQPPKRCAARTADSTRSERARSVSSPVRRAN